MSNLSVLAQNTLAGLSETAGLLYLNLLDTYQGWNSPTGERQAFFEADRYESLVAGKLDHILENYPGFEQMPPRIKADLKAFLTNRWKNNFTGKKERRQCAV